MTESSFKTIGTTFVEDISTAKNSDELFRILKDTCCITLKPEAVAEKVAHLDLPTAAIEFKATLARLQIAERNRVINKQLSQMKDKETMRGYLKRYLKQEREIPQVANYTYIAMHTYMKKKFGTAEEFKQGLHEHLVAPVMQNKEGRLNGENDNKIMPNDALLQKKMQERRISGLF